MSMDIAAVFEKMTTESGPLLGTGNYKPWARACKTALESLLLFYVIEDDLPEKPTDYFEEVFEESTATIRKDKPDAVYNGQMTAWYADVEDYIADNEKAKELLLRKCAPSIIGDDLKNVAEAKFLWSKLKSRYLKVNLGDKHFVYQKITRISLASCNNEVFPYVGRLLDVYNELQDMDAKVPDWMFTSHLIYNLDRRYDAFIEDTLERNEQMPFKETIQVLMDWQKDAERRGLL